MRPTGITIIVAISLLCSTLSLHAQIVTDMREESGGGVVTNTSEGSIQGTIGTAEGIIFEWEKTLEDFEQFDGAEEIEEQVSQRKESIVRFDNLQLPQIIDENGIDLFLLTEDGITIYLAMSAPVYLQDTGKDIVKWIRYYAYHKRKNTAALFSRYEKWETTIKSIFTQRGVPQELAELCMVESGCTYRALSHAGALGMWQIMPETGRAYGMTINGYLDERTDPMKSTLTAAQILRRNYDKIGDWTLATAAYNCGPGRFLKKDNKGKTWPEMVGILPKETQQYIPSLIAIHYVWTYRRQLEYKTKN